MRLLIIDDLTQKVIDRLIENAAANPCTMDNLLDRYNGEESPVGDEPDHVIKINQGYTVVYSEELQPAGRVRHMSVSVDTPYKLPSPEAVSMLMEAFKFKGSLEECQPSMEDVRPGLKAINVLEVI